MQEDYEKDDFDEDEDPYYILCGIGVLLGIIGTIGLGAFILFIVSLLK